MRDAGNRAFFLYCTLKFLPMDSQSVVVSHPFDSDAEGFRRHCFPRFLYRGDDNVAGRLYLLRDSRSTGFLNKSHRRNFACSSISRKLPTNLLYKRRLSPRTHPGRYLEPTLVGTGIPGRLAVRMRGALTCGAV